MRLGNIEIEVVRGDITQQPDVTAIVNSANAHLQIDNGVAGAIHTAAGKGLAEECEALAPIKTTQAVITAGHELPNKHIIHVLGPVHGFSHPEISFLRRTYKNALELAEKHKIDSIAFPAISTGSFGYPFEEATEIAIKAVKDFSTKAQHLRLLRFVLLEEDDRLYYEQRLKEFSSHS